MRTEETRLCDDERLAKINTRTGEIVEVTSRRAGLPDGKEVHYKEGKFAKRYEIAWDYLLDHLSDKELRIVTKMELMARPNSNSLEPLSQRSTVQEIADTFGVHRNNIVKMIENLFNHGVYAEFNVATSTGVKRYWVLNPYISFKGRIIDSALVDLFRKTTIARLCTRP